MKSHKEILTSVPRHQNTMMRASETPLSVFGKACHITGRLGDLTGRSVCREGVIYWRAYFAALLWISPRRKLSNMLNSLSSCQTLPFVFLQLSQPTCTHLISRATVSRLPSPKHCPNCFLKETIVSLSFVIFKKCCAFKMLSGRCEGRWSSHFPLTSVFTRPAM